MVYFYAVMGVMMMTGIMAIFEMGLSLTGQSLLPNPPDKYLSSNDMKRLDVELYEYILDKDKSGIFSDSVSDKGLCDALKSFEKGSWMLIKEGESNEYFVGSCQLTRGDSHRSIVRSNVGVVDLPYQLFSCVLGDGKNICPFEEE